VGFVAGLIVMVATRFEMASSGAVAILAGAAVAILVGGSMWTVIRSRARSHTEERERGRRLSERWSTEVLPTLQKSGLPDLVAYESALSEMERRRTESQRLRLEAEKEDLQAAAASQAAASLESRRAELTGLKSEEPLGSAGALAARLEEFNNNLHGVRQRMEDGERRLQALRSSLRQAADDAVREAALRLKQ